jgi:lipoprotein-releasing system ATP-binding protein
MLRATDVTKSYGQLQVLKGVSITLGQGEVVALVGASGAGKSTLLQILGTLDDADGGSIHVGGNNITRMSEKQKAHFRNESLGFVFQFHHLLPEFSAIENICLPAWIAGQNKEETIERAKALLAQLGLEARGEHKPTQLSGGEQQRISMARALINRPKLILADEPTGNLDTRNSEDLYRIIFDLARSTGVTFLIATHNLALAAKADRTCHIEDGIIVKESRGEAAT